MKAAISRFCPLGANFDALMAFCDQLEAALTSRRTDLAVNSANQ
jgi:hypothetical protein